MITKADKICAICGKPAECTHHLIGGTGKRKLADEDGLTIPLCNSCHNMAVKATERIHGNPMAEILSKMLGQLAWEMRYIEKQVELPFDDLGTEAREAFLKRYGKRYL